MRYTVIFPKGGVGKSTLAAHLATELVRRHGPRSTLLVDGDPDRTLADWVEWRREAAAKRGLPEPVGVHLSGQRFYDHVIEASRPYRDTVIDAPGHDNVAFRLSLAAADRAIMPIPAASFGASRLRLMLDALRFVREHHNPDLDAIAVIYGVHPSSKRSAEDLRAFLAERGLPSAEQVIHHRQAYVAADDDGLTVEDLRPRTRGVAAATHEMAKLYSEVLS